MGYGLKTVKLNKLTAKWLSAFPAAVSSANARFYAFTLFIVCIFLMGGGSRDDIQSLLLLRPLSIIFVAYAFSVSSHRRWTGNLLPVFMLATLAILMMLQLAPLPPSVWSELPQRQIYFDIATLAGMEQPWRPLTLSPSKTLNSLFSLSVPLAAMLLFMNLERPDQRRALVVILLLAYFSAILAMLQLGGSSSGPLYFYQITNNGQAVGLFANRNHQAVLLACAIVIAAWYAGTIKRSEKSATIKVSAAIASIFVLLPLIFITGSRAGLVLALPAFIFALLFVYNGKFFSDAPKKNTKRVRKSKFKFWQRFSIKNLIAGAFILTLVSIVGAAFYASRTAAFDRLTSGDAQAELRLDLLPTLLTMVQEYMPWGTGFGSFEHVYKIFEPLDLLKAEYLNQAHSDWLQILIEGGLPVVVLIVVFLGWLLARSRRVFDSSITKSRRSRIFLSVTIIGFLVAASIGDYPLRVPSMMAVLAVFLCVFSEATARSNR
jgi:hypothetical protein